MPDHLPKTRREALTTGSRTFYTGRPCKHDHLSPRLAVNYQCVECKAIHNASDRPEQKPRKAKAITGGGGGESYGRKRPVSPPERWRDIKISRGCAQVDEFVYGGSTFLGDSDAHLWRVVPDPEAGGRVWVVPANVTEIKAIIMGGLSKRAKAARLQ